MAANATFALKPGVWFLRVRFVIFAPDSRREPSPPSGRKSTQPTVQILKASSDGMNYVLPIIGAYLVLNGIVVGSHGVTAEDQVYAELGIGFGLVAIGLGALIGTVKAGFSRLEKRLSASLKEGQPVKEAQPAP